MSSREIAAYLSQFRQNLQYKIAKAIAVRALIFLALFGLIQILMTRELIEIRSKSEQSYLKMIGTQMIDKERLQIERVLMFLDSSRKLSSINYSQDNVSSTCESDYFDCSTSTAPNYSEFYAIYLKIRSNIKAMAYNYHSTSIFMYNDLGIVYLNLTTLEIETQRINTTIVSQFVSENPTVSSSGPSYNRYVLGQSAVNSSTYYQLLCEHLAEVTLCIILIKDKIFPVPSAPKSFSFVNSTFPTIDNDIAIKSFDDWFSLSYTGPVSHQISQCLQGQSKLTDFFHDPEAGLFVVCTSNLQFLYGLLGNCFSYAYFQINLSPLVVPERYKATTSPSNQTISYYISSNTTYNQDINSIISQQLTHFKNTSYGLILSLTLSLFLIMIAIQQIENNLINSIISIKSLCEHLKNKEDKQFQSVPKPTIFTFITDYFHKFMWIYKLLKFKSKYRHKKLLIQGIELFSKDYAPVQEYILRELIAIETNQLEKYLKIRCLPNKRKATARITHKLALPSLAARKDNRQTTQSKRRYANMQLIDPDDDQLMKNISIGYRGNRGVRFSNDIQTIEIDRGPVLRKTKFSEITPQSCATIKNNLSQPEISSMKQTQNKESIKSLKDEEESYTSLNEINRSRKKDNTLRSRGLESIHFDLNNMRLDESVSQEDQDALKQVTEQEEIYQLGLDAITQETVQSYRKIIQFYNDLIALKSKNIEHIANQDTLILQISNLYELTLQKYIKMGELLTFQNENRLFKNQHQRQAISEFADLAKLQQSYLPYIKHELVQKGQVIKLMIRQALQLPVPFKNLQYLANSNQKDTRILARLLIATMAQQVAPHLDEVLFHNLAVVLQQQSTSHTLKRKILALLTRTLERYFSLFSEEISELKLVRQFYNIKNKKIYFLASLSNPKPFNKLLTKFYQWIHPFDLISVFNLDEETSESIEQDVSETYLINARPKPKRSLIEQVKFLLDLEDFTDMFNFNEKIKESSQERGASSSSKTISKKRVYEREFHEILTSIECDQADFARYIVVLLGQEHGSYSGQAQDSSASGNRRPYQQKIHQEITKFIDRGYHHFILGGQQLSAYPSKYGRLKKYLKLAPELLELDLSDRDQEENYRLLQKYLK